jgi:hypothetical protein
MDALDELGIDDADMRETIRMGLAMKAAANWARDTWRQGDVQIDIRPDGLARWRRQFTTGGQRYATATETRQNGLGLAALFKAATEGEKVQ